MVRKAQLESMMKREEQNRYKQQQYNNNWSLSDRLKKY